jgi:hypothetical protein
VFGSGVDVRSYSLSLFLAEDGSGIRRERMFASKFEMQSSAVGFLQFPAVSFGGQGMDRPS